MEIEFLRFAVHSAARCRTRPCPFGALAYSPPGPQNARNERSNATVASAFQALSASVQLASAESIDRHVREMLRPMLKQWLDDNLPVMVERMVRAEIERVARGGR